jgi:serine/threonine-protein kinase
VDDLQDQLQAALGDRYAIEREIGHGGAAIVFLARDEKHARQVAIKVLRPDLAQGLGADRFLREIRTAAGLQHPHIVPLHDSGEAGGFLYYVMPYVEGESLRRLLEREPVLPLERALGIAQEVALALAYAHRHGLVHRDVKPENILISDGHALVTDFGIARAISAAGGDGLTGAGLAVGTPAYMSPEQASAEREIDGRADIYALGCVTYEMLAGHPPFLGRTGQELFARHLLDPVPPLRTIRRDLPESVERAVLKALAKTPADRFETTSGFTEALAARRSPSRSRWSRVLLPLAVLLVAAVTIAVIRLSRIRWGAGAADGRTSLAVLPFANVSGDSSNAPFSDGIADELTTELGKVEGLSVAARTSAVSFRTQGLDAREIGRRLRVQYVVDGKVRSAENRRRVSAQLIDVSSGHEVWSDEFEHDARDRDVFAVQDSITRAIVRELRMKLSPATSALLARRSTSSSEAHDLYLQGRYFFAKRDLGSLVKAQSYFEQAIAKDSGYAAAYAGLSEAYSHYSVFGGAMPGDMFPRARAAVEHALRLDSTLAEAHTSLGFISLFYDWDFAAAGREFDRSLALDPRYPATHLFRGWYFLGLDRPDEAVAEFRSAIQLDPFSSVNNLRLSTGLLLARRFDEALVQSRKVIELDSTWFMAKTELGHAYLAVGRCSEAIRALESQELAAALNQGLLGYAYAKCGRTADAMAELRHVADRVRAGAYISHYAPAMIYAGLGDANRVFAELDSAYVERAWPLFVIRRDPAFDGVREDPRFAALLQRIGQSR